MTRKTVKGIVTNGCTNKEYRAIYRQRTPEARIRKAIELGKLDTKFYNKLIKTLKGDPRTRRLIRFIGFLAVMGGMTQFTVTNAVTSILYHTVW
jgi:hypothetical protein